MRILYLMHVDWNWIKQRPQFIAEYLQKSGCKVDVYYLLNYMRNRLTNNSKTTEGLHIIPQLPGRGIEFIDKINRRIYKCFIKKVLRRTNYDAIYITHPCLYTSAIKGKIIYDCMDDHVAFPLSYSNLTHSILGLEKQLLKESHVVLFSSENLAYVIRRRANIEQLKYFIINNAIDIPSSIQFSKTKSPKNSDELVLTYIGTVSTWFDFVLLDMVCQKYPSKKIIYNIYGPIEYKLDNSCFNYKGIVSHDSIFEVMDEADILIMPFMLNDLIKSVNPVKLYEYIYSGKPIICVRYSETEKFSDYVYLYDNGDYMSFIEQLDIIVNNDCQGKVPKKIAQDYVKKNSWSQRVCDILQLLE